MQVVYVCCCMSLNYGAVPDCRVMSNDIILVCNDMATIAGKFEEDYDSWDGCLPEDQKELLTHIFETPVSLRRRSHEDSSDGYGAERTCEEVDAESALPQLRRIPCPVPRCSCHIAEEDLSIWPQYVEAYSAALVVIDSRRSHRSCCLQPVMDCDATPVALSTLVCLGCSHFYHPACFLHMVRAELDNVGRQRSQVACYLCRADSRRCECVTCQHRGDRPVGGAHVINATDMEMARQLLLDTYHTDAVATRSGHPHLSPSNVVKLASRWADVHATVSVAAVVNTDQTRMFECKCGSVYEVDRPCPGFASPCDYAGNSSMSDDQAAKGTEHDVEAHSPDIATDRASGQPLPPTACTTTHRANRTSRSSFQITDDASPTSLPPPEGAVNQQTVQKTFQCVNSDCQAVYCAQVRGFVCGMGGGLHALMSATRVRHICGVL